MAFKLHTHDGVNDFIPYDEMLNRLLELQDQGHIKHFNVLKKRVSIIKDDLDSLMKKLEDQLRKDQPMFTKKAKDTMQKVVNKGDCKELEGKYLRELLDGRNIYEGATDMGDVVKQVVLDIISRVEQDLISFDIRGAAEHFLKGDEFLAKKKYQQAIKQYELTSTINPLDLTAMAMKGLCLSRLDQYEESLKTNQRLLILTPKTHPLYDPVYWFIDVMSQGIKQNRASIEYWTKEIEGNHGAVYMCYSARGDLHCDAHRYDKALEDYTAAIKSKPLKKYYLKRFDVYNKLGREAEAQQELELMKAAPDK